MIVINKTDIFFALSNLQKNRDRDNLFNNTAIIKMDGIINGNLQELKNTIRISMIRYKKLFKIFPRFIF
jgi:hypothetical protein